MDGSLAALFALVAAADLAFGARGCGLDGCDAPEVTQARTALQYGEVLYQGERQGGELYLQQMLPWRFGGLEPVLGISVSADGDTWVGAGLQWTGALPHDSFVQLSLLPGFHAQTDGPDLGHMIEFRSSIGVGYAFDNGARLSLQFDHRSNAELSDPNPGLETFGLRVALPL
ncbi:MAG: acyloxyacyl hydrolase [Limimaricola soesokkakensis]|uniref:acyloxyacyl hydrolase n=1 Tax=Limimaricola soesokkakensis TaxID=1343159 RepID=UPI004059A366